MKQFVSLFILSVALLFFMASEGGGKPSVRQLPHLGNTPYQADTILAASEYRSTLVDTDNLEISTI